MVMTLESIINMLNRCADNPRAFVEKYSLNLRKSDLERMCSNIMEWMDRGAMQVYGQEVIRSSWRDLYYLDRSKCAYISLRNPRNVKLSVVYKDCWINNLNFMKISPIRLARVNLNLLVLARGKRLMGETRADVSNWEYSFFR